MKEFLNVDLHRMTLRQLRGVVALERAGSVTGAAALLGLTPPAVSLQLRQLEELVGMPVTERSPSGLRLTAVGRELALTARHIEASLRDCHASLEALRGKEGGRVVVGGVSTAKYFLPRAVAAFAAVWPDVSVHLRIGNRDEVVASLRSGEIDLAVTGRPPGDFEIRRAVVGEHPYLVVAAPGHPLATGKPARPESRRTRGRPDRAGASDGIPLVHLAGEPMLLREKGSGTRALCDGLFAEVGLEPPSGMEMGSNESIKQGVMAGLGIAVISAHTVAVEVESGRLVVLPVQGLPVIKEWFVTRRRDKRLLPAAQAFWDFMATRGGEFLPAVPGLRGGRRVISPEWSEGEGRPSPDRPASER